MSPERIVVFLPCHSLDDFPTWLDDREAGDLLSAWTAAWHPALIAAVGSAPGWASVETPPGDAATLLGIVPPNCDDRFATLLDVAGLAGSHFVRQAQGRDATSSAALDAVAEAGLPAARDAVLVADFYALGLAWLLAELLARRMRSSTGIVGDDFSVAVVAAARAAVAGKEAAAREKLRECFGALEATRSQYYAVDVWLLDLVLLAESTLGERLADELNAPTPLGLLATGELLERLGRDDPALLERLRARIAEGMCEVVGGRDDDSSVDSHLLEALGASFDRGAAIQQRLLGVTPVTFGQARGGSSAYLPQLLHDRGYRGAIWNLFDGTPLPDPGSSRIRWHGPDGSAIEAVARSPLDARAAGTFLQLAEKVGDAMDHDHSCILAFAHHAGTACPWFHDLRRIAAWTTLLGRFVTPATLFAETENAGTRADFAADAFPPGLPGTSGASPADEIDGRVATAAAEAAEWAAGAPAVAECVPAPTAPGPVRQRRPGLWRGVFGARAADDDRLVLENDSLRLTVHPRSGGVLSLRVPGGRANRLSQAIAVRSTRPPPPVGAAWESPEERSEYSQMVADQITRRSDSEIVSRGRMVAATGSAVGSFTQRVTLMAGLPLVRLDIDVEVEGDLAGPLFEAYVASRFAWNENEDVDLRRSLHGESIVTERTRFTAPHFIEIVPVGERAAKERVLIATGGLPWHVRCTPHVVDTILTATGAHRASRRLLLGLGIEAPRSVALALLREPGSAARTAVERAP